MPAKAQGLDLELETKFPAHHDHECFLMLSRMEKLEKCMGRLSEV